MIFCLIIAAAVVLLDQVSKLLILPLIPDVGDTLPGIKYIFHLDHVENEGMALGLLENARWLFMSVSVIAIAALIVYIAIEKPKSPWVRTALGMIIGGGVGNMIDRVFRGTVFDFVRLDLLNFKYVFNVADMFVTVGCAIIVAYLLFVEFPRESRKKKAEKPAKKDGSDE